MPSAASVVVVIPAYGEGETIGSVVAMACKEVSTVIVVDDGSGDATGARASAAGATVLRHADNRGKAAALRSGFDWALRLGARAVITLDGDGQHDPADIPRLIESADRRLGALVIGARSARRQGAPKARYYANAIADFWISRAAGCRIVDSQSGFRLYPEALLRSCRLPVTREKGFVFESEILIDAARTGYAVVAVPVATRYPANARKSHFRPVVDISRIVRMVAWKIFSRRRLPLRSSEPRSETR
ncbi:MAG TPA: glycosyltransferase family 2 protein [Gammaproteobacteria bacterium]|nr:glycosyltransferase family 2 protein [Gammaproteobacteria bacterium]